MCMGRIHVVPETCTLCTVHCAVRRVCCLYMHDSATTMFVKPKAAVDSQIELYGKTYGYKQTKSPLIS